METPRLSDLELDAFFDRLRAKVINGSISVEDVDSVRRQVAERLVVTPPRYIDEIHPEEVMRLLSHSPLAEEEEDLRSSLIIRAIPASGRAAPLLIILVGILVYGYLTGHVAKIIHGVLDQFLREYLTLSLISYVLWLLGSFLRKSGERYELKTLPWAFRDGVRRLRSW